MNINNDFHIRLKELRISHQYSQSDVAKHLGISRQAIHQWEAGKSYPDIENIILLCKLYNITTDQLLTSDLKSAEKETHDREKTTSSNELSPVLEVIGLAIVLYLSTQIPLVGLPTAIIVAVWNKKKKRNYKIIYLLCIVCFLSGIHNIYSLLDYIYDFGYSTIEKIG